MINVNKKQSHSVRSKPRVALWQAKVRHYQPLIERIIAQSERRVLAGEPVPAGEKLVSLFEPHADIIVKGSRDADYGHKLNLIAGLDRSGKHILALSRASSTKRIRRLSSRAMKNS